MTQDSDDAVLYGGVFARLLEAAILRGEGGDVAALASALREEGEPDEKQLGLQVIPTPSHFLGRISPIFPPFFPVFCAFSPSRRGGSNEPQAGAQGQETVARAPKHRFAGLANSGCSERMAAHLHL